MAMPNAPHDSEFDLHVCAITRDQASMDIALESVFHISPAFQNHFPIYQTEVVGNASVIGAEGYSRKLRQAIEEYRNAIDNGWKPRVDKTQAKEQSALRNRLAQRAFLSYWTKVENNLHLLIAHIEAIGTDAAVPTRDAWRKMLFVAACEEYRIACGHETPRQIRAYAKGFQKLKQEKEESVSETTEIKEEKNEPAS
jgi:CRISPR system Cascade subunit CasA